MSKAANSQHKNAICPAAVPSAALILATSPAFDLQLTHGPMSDIPAMALWTVVLALLPRLSRNSALLAGVVAGTAILVRPNLAPLAHVPGAFLVWNAAAKRQARPLPFSDCCSSESDRCPHASWSPI
jgi:hypothetical protein